MPSAVRFQLGNGSRPAGQGPPAATGTTGPPCSVVLPLQMPMAASVDGPATPSVPSDGVANWNARTASAVPLSNAPVDGALKYPSSFSLSCRHFTEAPFDPITSRASARHSGGGSLSTPE